MPKTQILIVEDEGVVALDIKNRLKRLGYNVLAIAASGEQAVNLATTSQPDLVLMDIKLKGVMDGVTAAEQIKSRFDIPIIYLTAYADDTTLQRAKITEAHGYLLKPLEEKELHTTIEMALYKHQMEKRLRENERWLSTTLTSIGEAVIATDAYGKIEFLNPIAETLTGWSQEEALGRDVIEIFKVIPRQTRIATEHPITTALEQKSIVHLTEHLLIARDGTEIAIRDSIAPIYDEQDKVVGVVVVFQDVTEELAIRERVQQQERLAAVGQLAAGIAHEFNNILTSIIGFAELISFHPDNPVSVISNSERITEQGQRAAHLVRQVLDFSRKSIIEKKEVELAAWLEDTFRLVKRMMPENILTVLEIEPRKKPYIVKVDPARLQQALTNLAVNAREAMATGGILRFRLSAVTLQAGDPLPTPEMSPGLWFKLSISDQGKGISSDQLPHIFEPFFTTKEFGQGSGLGLSQVYGIIKQHEGDITVDTQPEQGTTFTLYLPAFLTTEATPEDKPVKVPKGKGEGVLLVEEEPTVREVIQVMLEYLGYSVVTAGDEREALETFENNQEEIKLVLTEITTSTSVGMAFIRALKRRNPAVKVVILSGYPFEEEATEWLSHNVVGWLPKPVNLRKLAQTMQQHLQGPEN